MGDRKYIKSGAKQVNHKFRFKRRSCNLGLPKKQKERGLRDRWKSALITNIFFTTGGASILTIGNQSDNNVFMVIGFAMVLIAAFLSVRAGVRLHITKGMSENRIKGYLKKNDISVD